MARQLDLRLGTEAPDEALIARLRRDFPGAFLEGRLDAQRLLESLGLADPEDGRERYGMGWHGRAEAMSATRSPAAGALVPDPVASMNFEVAENVVIEGDNLEVLKLLLPAYEERVKMIFIDPPYNTAHDFLYEDDFRDTLGAYLAQTGQVDDEGRLQSSRADLRGRRHSRWLTMMWPRLALARRLLRQDGAIFITIDDHEAPRLRMLCDEIFGDENFVAQIAWQKRYTRSNNTDGFTSVIDQVLLYRRSEAFQPNLLPRTDKDLVEFKNPDDDPRGPWKTTSFLNQVPPDKRPNLSYPIENPNTGEVTHNDQKAWRTNREGFERLQREGRLWWGKDGKRRVPQVKTYLTEIRQGLTPTNFWSYTYAGHTDQGHQELKELFGRKVFDTPKPSLLVRRMLEHATGPEDLVLDFFAGSGTTAQAVLEANAGDGGRRRYVLVQLPEAIEDPDYDTICDITRDRARRVAARLEAVDGETDPRGRGYRAFRLLPSALPRWEAVTDEASLKAQMKAWLADTAAVTDQERLTFEVLCRAGLPLTSTIEPTYVGGRDALMVAGDALLVCWASPLDDDFFEGVLASGTRRLVVREAAFSTDDALRVRASSGLRAAGIDLRTV